MARSTDHLPDGKNLIFVDENLNYQRRTAEEVHSSSTNSWKGWYCSIGFRSLYIDFDGNAYRGVCREGGWLGNVNVVPPPPFFARAYRTGQWLQCNKTYCTCGADMGIPKVKNKEDVLKFFPKMKIEKFELAEEKETIEPSMVFTPYHNDYKLITWELGRRCNFDCWYCFPNSHNNYESHKNYDMMMNAYRNLSKMWIFNEKTKFNFTGGELTVYKDYLPFVKTLVNDNHIVMTTTNGSHNPDYYAELAEVSDICFSLHLNYLKKFGIDKFIKNIESVVNVRKSKSDMKNWIGVRIMADPGNVEFAKEVLKICNEKFGNEAQITVDAIHITGDQHQLHRYTEEEIIWINNPR